MATTRLTNDLRHTIAKRAIEHGFAKREAALLAEEHVLARSAYDLLYPKKIQDAMNALPNGFFPTDGGLTVFVEGRRHGLVYAPGIELREAANGDCLKVRAADSFGKKVVALAEAKENFIAERKAARHEANSVLASVSSLARLLEVWPAVESFTKDIGSSGKPITALAVPIKKLNTTLGLPPDAK